LTETGRARESLTTAPDATMLQHFVLNYDSVGNVYTWASDLADAPQDMTYDDLYRLRTAESRSGQAWRYQYNDVGDFTLKSDVGDYRYGERGLPARLLTSAGADQFSYSAAGRLTLSGTGTFTYDAYGRLVRLERGDDRVTTDYWVDDARSRIVTRRGGAITELLCLGDGFEIENGVAAVYVSHDPWCIARLSLDTGERRYLHRDHLGSVTLVTDAAGRQVARRAYDPFGGVIAAGASTLGPRLGVSRAPGDEGSALVFTR